MQVAACRVSQLCDKLRQSPGLHRLHFALGAAWVCTLHPRSCLFL